NHYNTALYADFPLNDALESLNNSNYYKALQYEKLAAEEGGIDAMDPDFNSGISSAADSSSRSGSASLVRPSSASSAFGGNPFMQEVYHRSGFIYDNAYQHLKEEQATYQVHPIFVYYIFNLLPSSPFHEVFNTVHTPTLQH